MKIRHGWYLYYEDGYIKLEHTRWYCHKVYRLDLEFRRITIPIREYFIERKKKKFEAYRIKKVYGKASIEGKL